MVAKHGLVLFDELAFFEPALFVDTENIFHNLGVDSVESFDVYFAGLRKHANRGFHSLRLSIHTVENPFQNSNVVAKAGPNELSFSVLSKPIDSVDFRQFGARPLSLLNPMVEKVAHIVAAEREHCKRVPSHSCLQANGGGGHFGTNTRAHKNAVRPVQGLVHQRNSLRPPSSEEDGADGHALRLFPVLVGDWTLAAGRSESGVRVCAGLLGGWVVLLVFPGDGAGGTLVSDVFPPNVAVGSDSAVGEDAVFLQAVHCVGVGFVGGAGRNAEEPVFWVQRVDLSVFSEAHPRNVVAQRLDLESGHIGFKHCEVGFSAGAGEGGGNVLLFLGGLVSDAHNEHVLGEPALALGHIGGDSEGEAFLSEESVSAVSASVAPHLVGFRELDDELVLNGGAGPFGVFLSRFEGVSDGVNAGDEVFVGPVETIEHCLSHSGHDFHVADHVLRVSQLDPDLRKGGSDGAHTKGNHVQSPSSHAASVVLKQRPFHVFRSHPIVRRTRILFLFAADERPVFNAGHIGRVAVERIAIRSNFFIQFHALSQLYTLFHQCVVLFVGTVAPMNVVGLHNICPLRHKG